MHSHETNLAIEKIDQIPDVISIMKTTGDYDLQVYAMIKDLEHLLKIQDSLSNIDSIAKIDMEISWILNKWPTPRQYISTF
jgi:DNA-binding Lrp family transcriptional regulator